MKQCLSCRCPSFCAGREDGMSNCGRDPCPAWGSTDGEGGGVAVWSASIMNTEDGWTVDVSYDGEYLLSAAFAHLKQARAFCAVHRLGLGVTK